MLTPEERKNTKIELNENFHRLNYSKDVFVGILA